MSQSPDLESGFSQFEITNLPKLVELISRDEDDDLIVFRQFKNLNLFALLYQQKQLTALEGKIKRCGDKDVDRLNKLLPKACRQLRDYNGALLQQAQILKLAKPAQRITDLLVDQSNRGRSQLNRGRSELKNFINSGTMGDLVSLVSNPKGPIHAYIDNSPWLRSPFLKRQKKGQIPGLDLYAEKYVRRTEKVLINVMFVTLVLVPIGTLPHIASAQTKVMVVVGATMAAAILVAGVLDDYYRTSLSLMAAYTAILVVFLGSTI